MKWGITTIALLFLLTSMGYGQNLDTRTQNQIKAKFSLAKELSDQGSYKEALEKVKEMESLLNGARLPSLLNFKVKTLIVLGKYKEAKDVLYILEGLELSEEIINNIGSYSVKIEKGLERENEIKISKLIEGIKYKTIYFEYAVTQNSPKKIIRLDSKDRITNYTPSAATYINARGLIPIKQYDGLGPFSKEGLAAVYRHTSYYRNKCGYIDETGKEIVPLDNYTSCDDFNSGYANIKTSNPDEEATTLYTFRGFLNSKGEVAMNLGSWEGESVGDGLFRFSYSYSGLLGYCDINKNIIVPPGTYDYFYDFSEGLAWVGRKGGSYSVIDKTGKTVFGSIYLKRVIQEFKYGLTIIETQDGMNAVLDSNGKYVLLLDKDYSLTILSKGFIRVRKKGNNAQNDVGIFKQDGQQLFEIKYKWVWFTPDNHFITTSHQGAKNIYNINGALVSKLEYSDVKTSSQERRAVKFGSKYGYIDMDGNKKIDYIYEEAQYFKEGLASVKKDGKYGVIDLNGNQVIPFIYDNISYFFDGMAFAELDGKKIIIDTKGNEIK